MIKISEYGFRDGVFNVRTLKTQQKRYKEDFFHKVIASTISLGTCSVNASAGTTFRVGTQLDAPRRVKVKAENKGASGVRQKVMSVTGYTGQGEYATELLSLATADNGYVRSNNAFAKIVSANITSGTRIYGTYGTVTMYPTNEFGLTEYLDASGDGLNVQKIASVGTRTVSTPFAISANRDVTYQTVRVGGVLPEDSVKIRYLSKFQNRRQSID